MDYIGLLTEYSSCCVLGSDRHLVNLTPQAFCHCISGLSAVEKKKIKAPSAGQLLMSSLPKTWDEKEFKSQLALSLGDGSKELGRGEAEKLCILGGMFWVNDNGVLNNSFAVAIDSGSSK